MRARLAARRHDERGAYAVLFAMLSVLLFGIAALAVDLGNVYDRRAETQSQADLAALSAAPALATSHAAATAQVATYLNRNLTVGQAAVTASQLTDGNPANGEVTFPTTYSMRVVTPQARVAFALAAPLTGTDSTEVAATATVTVGTPGANRVMPFFAVTGSGCDYGAQALSDPANGQHQSVVPALAPPTTNVGQTSNATLTSLTPYQFDQGAVGAVITTINGNHLSSVNKIGFYRTPSESPNQFEEVITTNSNNNTISSVPVPPNVTNYPGVWWLRTYTSSGNKGWSPLDQSLPVRIGDGPIQCGNLSTSGNFGTLKLPRSTSPSTWIPDNIARGLEPPLTLSVQQNSASIPLCAPGGVGVVYSPTTGSGTRYANTNCVDTDTGLTAQTSTQGMITGTGTGAVGRLLVPTTESVPGRSCGVGHTANERSMLGYTLNDDTLSCFMNDPSMKLSTIASASYTGPAVLNPAIYQSPRFCYVPVLGAQPTSGGSLHYSVVDMRPCFITSESNDSSYNTQQFTDGTVSSTANGLTIPTNKVTTMRVFFFNKAALPADGGSAQPGLILSPTGPLAPVLVD
ncbi:MAG TPA: pilus assembly protein TadG-related protein [Nocardioides sp.]|uniref:pilus assembly protein TadG-related protein n=1 Tax=Nocardioides sp. TaxID=35761 RepID=UPI002C0FB637|nr:pilus assembly protein TadG-related protein [Nocardioides sp.]HQR27166.1 pilus assembly protein TadG-related protein [Nocardioides sp.]